MAPFEADAHWMRSLHCGRDDRVFGCGDRAFGYGDRVFGWDDGVFGWDDKT